MVIDLAMQIKDEIKQLITDRAELQHRVDSLTAEVEAQRKRANDAERGVLSEEWYVCRDRYEDDIAELKAENKRLRDSEACVGCDDVLRTIAELTAERDKLETKHQNDYDAWKLQMDKLVAERDELQAELDACKLRERVAEDYDFRAAAQRWEQAFENKCGEVIRLQEALDAIENGQFYAMYRAKCEECEEAVSFAKRLENAVKDGQPVTLFGVDYLPTDSMREERDYLQKVVKTQADSFKKLEIELAHKG